MSKRSCNVALIGLFLLLPQLVLASGFKIETQGSKATGMGAAFVAVADDPSAIAYNPAGLTQLEGTDIYLGTTVIIPTTKYESPAGASDTTDYHVFYPPHLYITSDAIKNVVFGLGIFSPGINFLQTLSDIAIVCVASFCLWR